MQVGEFLVRRDDHQNIVPGLAKSWKISADRSAIEFQLREGLYSADEVAQSLRRLLKFGQTTHSNLSSQTTEDGIEVVDSLTVRIRTKGDAGAVLSPLVMADAAILPDAVWSGSGADAVVDWRKSQGPYVLDSGSLPLKNGESIGLKPNKKHYFWRSGLPEWRITVRSLDELKKFDDLQSLLGSEPSFTTLRYWDYAAVFDDAPPHGNFYQTRPNGVAMLLPNLSVKSVFHDRAARQAFLAKLCKAQINLLNAGLRADQLAQPGLIGRLDEQSLGKIRLSLDAAEFKFTRPVRISVPKKPSVNSAWLESVMSGVGIAYEIVDGPDNPWAPSWKNGEFDLLFGGVGMSDTDPISGATFIFSPEGAGQDVLDGRILSLLNEAKGTTNPVLVGAAIRKAFSMAMEEAVVFPIHYLVNRHYFSSVKLNISDPFSESVRIWDVTVEN